MPNRSVVVGVRSISPFSALTTAAAFWLIRIPWSAAIVSVDAPRALTSPSITTSLVPAPAVLSITSAPPDTIEPLTSTRPVTAVSTVTPPSVVKSPANVTLPAASMSRPAMSASRNVVVLPALIARSLPASVPSDTVPAPEPVVSMSTIASASVVTPTPLKSTAPSTAMSPFSVAVSLAIVSAVGFAAPPTVNRFTLPCVALIVRVSAPLTSAFTSTSPWSL